VELTMQQGFMLAQIVVDVRPCTGTPVDILKSTWITGCFILTKLPVTHLWGLTRKWLQSAHRASLSTF
jgi:hypothetical protein